jgi:hypothetical protein
MPSRLWAVVTLGEDDIELVETDADRMATHSQRGSAKSKTAPESVYLKLQGVAADRGRSGS